MSETNEFCKLYLNTVRRNTAAKSEEKIDKRQKPSGFGYLAPNGKYYEAHCAYCAEAHYLADYHGDAQRYLFEGYKPVQNKGWVKFYEQQFDDLEKAEELGEAFVKFEIGDRETGGKCLMSNIEEPLFVKFNRIAVEEIKKNGKVPRISSGFIGWRKE